MMNYDELNTIVEGLKELNRQNSSWSGRRDAFEGLPYEQSSKLFECIVQLPREVRDDSQVAMDEPYNDLEYTSVTFWLLAWKEFLADFDRRAQAQKEALQKKRGSDFTTDL